MKIEMKRLPLLGAGRGLVLVTIALLLLAGCGRHRSEGTSATTAQVSTVEPVSQPASLAAPGDPHTEESAKEVTPGSLAPDLAVSASDTSAGPGDTFDIEARTSSDAISVVLWDGIGDRQSLQYDSASDVWRTSYRVPLRPRGERVELSVTARNGDQRWRRVWVFVPIQPVPPAADSSATP